MGNKKNIPEDFIESVDMHTNKELSEKYGVGLRLISKWRKETGTANVWKKQYLLNDGNFLKDLRIKSRKIVEKKYGISSSTAALWKKELKYTEGFNKRKQNKLVEWKVVESTGCWICTSHAVNANGYPQCKGDRLVALRVWKEQKGCWPKGAVCCHKCHNPGCINPDHIYPGSNKSNGKDMFESNRSPWGWRNGVKKLSPKEAIEIYSLKGKNTSQREVGKKYGVSQVAVWNIWNGLTWWRDVAGYNNFPDKLTIRKSIYEESD